MLELTDLGEQLEEQMNARAGQLGEMEELIVRALNEIDDKGRIDSDELAAMLASEDTGYSREQWEELLDNMKNQGLLSDTDDDAPLMQATSPINRIVASDDSKYQSCNECGQPGQYGHLSSCTACIQEQFDEVGRDLTVSDGQIGYASGEDNLAALPDKIELQDFTSEEFR